MIDYMRQHRIKTIFTIITIAILLCTEIAFSCGINGEPVTWQLHAITLIVCSTVLFIVWFPNWDNL